jgi:hydroxylamine reductase (hybrid-cluster protein)
MAEDTETKPTLTKEEKFIKLANNRSVRLHKQISLLKNLTAHAYEMNSEVAHEVLADIEKEVGDLRKLWENRLSGPRKRRKSSISVTQDSPEVVVQDPEAETDDEVEAVAEESPNAVLAALTSAEE